MAVKAMEFFKGFLLRKEFVSNQPTEKGGGERADEKLHEHL
jgi:hypothetical protein